MFGPVAETPYDLRFSLLGIPVTISPWFWLGSALFGFAWLHVEPGGPANLVAWVLCVLVSILVHEFGHALTMKAYGQRPSVLLYHFGGLAFPSHRETPGRSFLISAAGPAIQLVLYALIVLGLLLAFRAEVPWPLLATFDGVRNADSLALGLLIDRGGIDFGTPLFAVADSMLQINLYWPIINLLPVWPLDGGQMLDSALNYYRVRHAREWTLKVTIACGGIVGVYFLLHGRIFAAMLFVMLAAQAYRTLRGPQFGP